MIDIDLDTVELVVEAPETCRPVRGRPVQLEQVLLNLITNARDAIVERKAGPSIDDGETKGSIRIDVEDWPSRSEVSITVTDDGGGIPDHLLEHIFDPFFSTKDDSQRMGLGLSICYRGVARMGGLLRARNVEHGAQFEIILSGTPAVKSVII